MVWTLLDRSQYTPFEQKDFALGGTGVVEVLVIVDTDIPEGSYPLLDVELLSGFVNYVPGAPNSPVYSYFERQWRSGFRHRSHVTVPSRVQVTRIDKAQLGTIRVSIYRDV